MSFELSPEELPTSDYQPTPGQEAAWDQSDTYAASLRPGDEGYLTDGDIQVRWSALQSREIIEGAERFLEEQ